MDNTTPELEESVSQLEDLDNVTTFRLDTLEGDVQGWAIFTFLFIFTNLFSVFWTWINLYHILIVIIATLSDKTEALDASLQGKFFFTNRHLLSVHKTALALLPKRAEV